ncbi:MAG TPA: type IV pilin N-terminal domain-containing protein [Candidatus Thermoplasmatota archaeon]|nr:type IV pilin N-terminal domain-containing protein [Candidatus Thermoplasmatota archaeon]
MGKMKANRKFIEADDRAVSAVIGVILMVAITVAIAATVYVYVSGMIGGTKNQTPNVACTTDSTSNKITVATADADIKWDDIIVTINPSASGWHIWSGGGIFDEGNHTYPIDATVTVTAGDYIYLPGTSLGNVQVTLRYEPTNSLLGTWTVNV